MTTLSRCLSIAFTVRFSPNAKVAATLIGQSSRSHLKSSGHISVDFAGKMLRAKKSKNTEGGWVDRGRLSICLLSIWERGRDYRTAAQPTLKRRCRYSTSSNRITFSQSQLTDPILSRQWSRCWLNLLAAHHRCPQRSFDAKASGRAPNRC